MNLAAIIATMNSALFYGSLTVWAIVASRLATKRPLVPYEPCPRPVWMGRDVAFLVVLFLCCEVAAGMLVVRLTGVTEGLTAENLVARMLSRVVWLVLAALYLTAKNGATIDWAAYSPRRIASDVGLGLLTFLAAMLPVLGVQIFFVYVLDMPSKHPLIELAQAHAGPGVLALITVTVVLIAPPFEEFVFRVMLQGWLESQQVAQRLAYQEQASEKPGFAPLVGVSVLFGLMHYGHGPDPIALFVFSLFLGYLYRQTHRITPSLVVHAALNGWTMLNLWLAYAADGLPQL